MTWEHIDFEEKQVSIPWLVAKAWKSRTNAIPENAFEWLQLCRSNGNIAPYDYGQRMKRLRARWRKQTGYQYPQNAMRHCFASYHVPLHRGSNGTVTAEMLGHDDAELLHKTYLTIVKSKDVAPYWSILPASVEAQRKVEAKAKLNKLEMARLDEELAYVRNETNIPQPARAVVTDF